MNDLLMKLLDKLTGPVAEVVPSASTGYVTSAQPFHLIVISGFTYPGGRGLLTVQVLIEHHFQQGHRVKGSIASAAIQLVQCCAVELIDLPLDDFGKMLFFKLLSDPLPLWVILWKRKPLVVGFLTASDELPWTATSVWFETIKQRTFCATSRSMRRSFFLLASPLPGSY